MSYSIVDFHRDFPTEEACGLFLIRKKYPHKKLYFVPSRGCFVDVNGRQFYPRVGTIMENSGTPLTKWFYAMYLFSTSKNGVSAKELERQLGIGYKTAWKIARLIRSEMTSKAKKLKGIIEADETYVGGYRRNARGGIGKTPVLGLVQRNGKVRCLVSTRETHNILNNIQKNVKEGSTIISDELHAYTKVKPLGYEHKSVNHRQRQWASGKVYTNTIEVKTTLTVVFR